jgi:hypothetical protein
LVQTKIAHTHARQFCEKLEVEGAQLRKKNVQLLKGAALDGLLEMANPTAAERNRLELHLYGRWLSGSPIIRIGLALLVNLSVILQN